MQKQAPSVGRVATMVLFALSCFGLLLFLWLSFGGAIPLKPRGYRVQVAVPQAAQLAQQADVRVAGVSVGKVSSKSLDPNGNRTVATLELNRKFAPLRTDAKAILRQKTLLGETYLELTPGTSRGFVKDGGRLGDAQVQPNVYLDDILTALDPTTRNAFHTWQQSLAQGVQGGRGTDFNDTLGNLPAFTADATDLLRVLDQQSGAVRRLVSNTGTVFAALTRSRSQLHNLIVNSEQTFSATASQNQALAEAFRIFPTFLDESKATLKRLRTFAVDTRPLIRELRPVARDLAPTLRDVRALAPDLKQVFIKLDPLITASKTGLPALRDTLNALGPMLNQLGPFLSQLNPILEWLEQNQALITDFYSNGPTGVANTTTSASGGIGHYLRQFAPNGSETLSIGQTRAPGNRGNAYLLADAQNVAGKAADFLIFPNWDCNNVPGKKEKRADSPSAMGATPGCFVQPDRGFQGLSLRFPHVTADNYSH